MEGKLQSNLNIGGAREYLFKHNWPIGLHEVVVQNLQKCALRFYICDDSGSMAENDGNKLVAVKEGVKNIRCSRWQELSDSLKFHMGLSMAASSPTEFRFLNNSAPIVLGTNEPDQYQQYQHLLSVLAGSPSGGTPLCRHIKEVVDKLRSVEHLLISNNQTACVIIATDGVPSDGELAGPMRALKTLPCWVVVRLCTSDDSIVSYWNALDKELELNLEILDDMKGEALEIAKYNKWLTYGEPLHRLREFGISVKEVDLLDERKLTFEQIRTLFHVIYGCPKENIPYPEADWNNFIKFLATENANIVHKPFDPISGKSKDWIRINEVRHMHGSTSCTIC